MRRPCPCSAWGDTAHHSGGGLPAIGGTALAFVRPPSAPSFKLTAFYKISFSPSCRLTPGEGRPSQSGARTGLGPTLATHVEQDLGMLGHTGGTTVPVPFAALVSLPIWQHLSSLHLHGQPQLLPSGSTRRSPWEEVPALCLSPISARKKPSLSFSMAGHMV